MRLRWQAMRLLGRAGWVPTITHSVVAGDAHLLDLETHRDIPILSVKEFLRRYFPAQQGA